MDGQTDVLALGGRVPVMCDIFANIRVLDIFHD